jgi:hypothetical protein
MATQQILFAETIAGMKKAFKRKAYGESFMNMIILGAPFMANKKICRRVGFRLRDRELYQSWPQAPEESTIRT